MFEKLLAAPNVLQCAQYIVSGARVEADLNFSPEILVSRYLSVSETRNIQSNFTSMVQTCPYWRCWPAPDPYYSGLCCCSSPAI